MNIGKYWNAFEVALLARKYKYYPSVANFAALLNKINVPQWNFEQNRVIDGRKLLEDSGKIKLDYGQALSDLQEAVSERKAIARWSVGDGDKKRIYLAKSHLDNKPGNDELSVTYANGITEQMQNVSFDSDAIGFPPLIQLEFNYADSAGTVYYDRFYNQL